MSNDNTINFQQYKEDHEPAICGTLHCLACRTNHEGVAPIPNGGFGFKCPSCGLPKCVFRALVVPKKNEPSFQCSCGMKHFWVMNDRILCPLCGASNKICGPGSHTPPKLQG